MCITESFHDNTPPHNIGFDAAIEFSPHSVMMKKKKPSFWDKIFNKNPNLDIRDYKLGVDSIISRVLPNHKLYRCVTPSWDNSARKGKNGIIGVNSSPRLYYEWLNYIVKIFKPYSKDENFIFINAMNEWAEGNHLEPCVKYGNSYLEATKKALLDS